ncbi:MAG: hypothetical protein ACR2NC_00530 [Thermodesulfobacteriota bacterium]
MKKLLAVPLFLLIACAVQSAQQDNFDASVCNKIPVGVEKLAAIDPENKEFSISCADLERCTSIMAWDAPPNVPCH